MRLVLALSLMCSASAYAKEHAPQPDKKAEADKQEEEEYVRTHFFDDPLGLRRQPFFGGGEKKSFFHPRKDVRRGDGDSQGGANRRQQTRSPRR